MDEKVIFSDNYPTIDGIRAHIQEGGNGTPLLLVHGLGGPFVWSRVRRPLAETFRVVIVDLPGFGESDPPVIDMTPGQHAEFLLHVLVFLQIESAFVVGISYGGQVAAEFAWRFRGRTLCLGLIAGTGLMPRSVFRAGVFRGKLFDLLARRVVLSSKLLTCYLGRYSFHHVDRRPAEYCDVFHRQITRPGARDAWLNAFHNIFPDTASFDERLGNIRTPTLILWGECDRTVPPRYADAFRRRISASQLRFIPDCGHALPLEAPDEAGLALTEFFGTASRSFREAAST